MCAQPALLMKNLLYDKNRGRSFVKSAHWTRSSAARFHALRQLFYGVGIAPRECLFRRGLPRQPLVAHVLLRVEGDRDRTRQQQAEDVLRVVRDAGRVAVAPALEDFVLVLLA